MGSGSSEPGQRSGRPDHSGQAEAFDAIGDRYDEAFPHKEGQIAAGEWLIESLADGARVLDLGCGTGVPTARQLADGGLDVTGVDLSGVMVELARKNAPGAEFHQLDIADVRPDGIPGRDGTPAQGGFHAVAAFFSLLMLPREEIPVVLRTISQLLLPEGLFVLSMVEADVDDFAIPFLGNIVRVSGYLRDELRKVVEEAGFEIVAETSYSYAPAIADVPPEEQIFLRCRRTV